MLKVIDYIEKIIIRVLIMVLLLTIALGTCEIGRILILDIMTPPYGLLDISTVFDTFGIVLVILIGLELLKSMKMFLTEDRVNPQLVAEVAMIALCNKIITLDATHLPGTVPLGIAALLLALSAAYFVFWWVNKEKPADKICIE